MNVRVKLYAMLAKHLPVGAIKNESDLSVNDGVDVQSVLRGLHLPDDMCHLVLVNGLYLSPSERPGHKLSEGDHVAVWPPVAGG